jgi:uncharacterized protein YjcR
MTRAKSMTKSELAQAYNVCITTFHVWIRRAGLMNELFTPEEYARIKIFTPQQVQAIFDKLGEP